MFRVQLCEGALSPCTRIFLNIIRSQKAILKHLFGTLRPLRQGGLLGYVKDASNLQILGVVFIPENAGVPGRLADSNRQA